MMSTCIHAQRDTTDKQEKKVLNPKLKLELC